MTTKRSLKEQLICALVVFLLILSTTVGVFAASSSYAGEWYTTNAGSVNGAINGVYHKLNAGAVNVSYRVNGATKTYPVYIELQRERFGFDKSFGTLALTTTSGTKAFPTKADETSSKYYLVIGGGTKDTLHNISGTLSNK